MHFSDIRPTVSLTNLKNKKIKISLKMAFTDVYYSLNGRGWEDKCRESRYTSAI